MLGQADANARLQDRRSPRVTIRAGPASSNCGRFSGCAIAPTSCRALSRGSCVSVSSVITYFTLGSSVDVADDQREASPGSTAQQRIQIAELAALALMAHPEPSLRIPAARPMQQIERCRAGDPFCAAILAIQSSIPSRASCSSGASVGNDSWCCVAENR